MSPRLPEVQAARALRLRLARRLLRLRHGRLAAEEEAVPSDPPQLRWMAGPEGWQAVTHMAVHSPLVSAVLRMARTP